MQSFTKLCHMYISLSEVAALEFLTFQELFEVVPEYVFHIHVVMSLVSLELKPNSVPWLNLSRHLGTNEVRVVASHSCKQLSFLVAILPIFELPVLTIDKDSDNTLPAWFCEVSNTVIHIECDVFIVDSSCDLHDLRALSIYDNIVALFVERFFLFVDSFF